MGCGRGSSQAPDYTNPPGPPSEQISASCTSSHNHAHRLLPQHMLICPLWLPVVPLKSLRLGKEWSQNEEGRLQLLSKNSVILIKTSNELNPTWPLCAAEPDVTKHTADYLTSPQEGNLTHMPGLNVI